MSITQQGLKIVTDFFKWLISGVWKNFWKSLTLGILIGLIVTGYKCEVGPFKLEKKELKKPNINIESNNSGNKSIPGKLPTMP